MKLLFTADLHILLHKKNVPKDWALARYNALFQHYLKTIYSEKIDIFIIGGDIFDKKPELDELSLFVEFAATIPIPTIIYDGNHEATKRGKTFFTDLKWLSKVNNKIQVFDDIVHLEYFDICPYCKLKTLTSNHQKSNILLTHVRGNIPPHVVSEIDLEILKPWKLVLAGDLHSYKNSQENIVYPGSPVTVTFHRTEVSTGVVVVDTNTLEHKFIEYGLPQLIRKRITSKDLIEKTEFHHTIYEIEGNLSELSSVTQTDTLIDKKIIKRKFNAELSLKDLSIEQEIEQYAKKILKLNDLDASRIIQQHKEIINDNH